MRRESYIFLTICAVVLATLFAPSCANTSTPPSGGPKDTIPPIMEESVPLPNTTNYSIYPKKNSIILTFNEFVVLKDPASNFFVSPPLKKRIMPKIKGKSVTKTSSIGKSDNKKKNAS